MHHKNNSERINELAKKWKDGTITPEEKEEFERWYTAFEGWGEANVPGEVGDASAARGGGEAEDPALREQLFRSIRERVGLPRVDATRLMGATGLRVVSRRRRLWSAAAAVLLLVGIGTAWIYIRESRRKEPATIANQYNTILPPGSTKATLVLSDGKVVLLEREKDSTIKDGSGVSIRKAGGQLVYGAAAAGAGPAADQPVTYNTINVPRGGQYQLVLSDGTGVWLNSASSLRYPTVFRGDRRTVTLTGEGYFEVAKDKDHVFQVVAGGQVIDVLGTQFNINSYADEMDTRTTLLEGSVKVWLPGKADSMLLRPGQQSVLGKAATDGEGCGGERGAGWGKRGVRGLERARRRGGSA